MYKYNYNLLNLNLVSTSKRLRAPYGRYSVQGKDASRPTKNQKLQLDLIP